MSIKLTHPQFHTQRLLAGKAWRLNKYFADWLGELKPGAKFNISFADSGHVGDFPKAGARNERRYKFITKVIGQKVAEVMKALEKVEKIK